jgi:FkbM family methyltransferase
MMRWTHRIRAAAFERLPRHWQPIAAYHYYRARSLLEPELAFVCSSLRPGLRAIDVGANEGVYTHAFARCGAFVEAFEPQPRCLTVLRSYERRWPNVHVHGEALGDTPGYATLYVPFSDGRQVTGRASLEPPTEAASAYTVRTRTLDALGFKDVALIKIDVEGHELRVLRGARETIRACNPLLLVEIEQRHIQTPIASVFDEIIALGYEGGFLDRRRELRPLDEFDVSTHQPIANADVPRALYVNNFIFSPVSALPRPFVA